ncbi:hypothetical protein [Streptomyces sp. TR02-1]|uniref:hypothetical protein n=1 Tax=Streptomyces sp. TR02-1 TaxID=3385977 RepID=UPI0039A0971F
MTTPAHDHGPDPEADEARTIAETLPSLFYAEVRALLWEVHSVTECPRWSPIEIGPVHRWGEPGETATAQDLSSLLTDVLLDDIATEDFSQVRLCRCCSELS